MPNVVTVPNDSDSTMVAERARLSAWAASNSRWVYTSYNNESDHATQIRRVANRVETLDFSCHGNPQSFDGTTNASAPAFGSTLSRLPGFSPASAVYLSACNTGLTSNFASVSIAQRLANGTGCTVYGTCGYMVGTFAEGNENCWRGDDIPAPHGPLPAYPRARTASGRSVWNSFTPTRPLSSPGADFLSMTFGMDGSGRIWASFDPKMPHGTEEEPMETPSSISIDTAVKSTAPLVNALEAVLKSKSIDFPPYKMAPDLTINLNDGPDSRILDIYANGGLIRDRVTGETWRVDDPVALTAAITPNL